MTYPESYKLVDVLPVEEFNRHAAIDIPAQ